MNEVFLFLLIGFMVAIFLNWSQKSGGCLPIIALVFGGLLFGLLIIGR